MFLFRLSYTIFCVDILNERRREASRIFFKKIGSVCFIYWNYFAMLNVNSNKHIKILGCAFIFSPMHVLIRQTYTLFWVMRTNRWDKLLSKSASEKESITYPEKENYYRRVRPFLDFKFWVKSTDEKQFIIQYRIKFVLYRIRLCVHIYKKSKL